MAEQSEVLITESRGLGSTPGAHTWKERTDSCTELLEI